MLECPTAPELLLGVIDRQFPACSGHLNTILIRTEGDSEESAKPNYALVAGERDFDIHLVVGAAESGDYGIPVGKIDVGQRIVEIEENLEGGRRVRSSWGVRRSSTSAGSSSSDSSSLWSGPPIFTCAIRAGAVAA
jgi:hypothetical protein